jgi:Pectinacetylesterase
MKRLLRNTCAVISLGLGLAASSAAEAQTPWEYTPMNSAARTALCTGAKPDVYSSSNTLVGRAAPLNCSAPQVPQVVCRNDTGASGVATRLGTANAKHLLIFVEGGGACINEEMCNATRTQFNYQDFSGLATGHLNAGLFDRKLTGNAFAEAHEAFIPYCSGDLHAGNADRTIDGAVRTQHKYRGYANMRLYLEQVISQFEAKLRASPSMNVVLMGESAGGFGVLFNLQQLKAVLAARGLANHITLVDGSGPPIESGVGSTCSVLAYAQHFNFFDTFLKDCPSCTGSAVGQWLAEWHYQQMLKNPDVVHAFYSGDNDYLIKTLLGKSVVESPATATLPGVAACGGASVSYWEYARGMSNIRARMKSIPSTGGITASYLIHPLGLGTLHTFATEFYYSTTYTQDAALNSQIKLMTWLKNISDRCVYDAAKITFPSSGCQQRNTDPLHVGY